MRTSNKDRKACMLSVRTSNELRAKLQHALEKSGRTLTQEVEMRLERSFLGDEFVGGTRNAAFLGMLGASIRDIELKNGAAWLSDQSTWEEVAALAARIIAERQPGANIEQADSHITGKPRAKKLNLYGPQV